MKGFEIECLNLRFYWGKARSSWGVVTWLGGAVQRHIVGLYGFTRGESFYGVMRFKRVDDFGGARHVE